MAEMMILCGGSGSSKFTLAVTRGIASERDSNKELDLKFISNVADNFWHHGLYVCPDVDIILYALAGKLDESKGWGIASDTFVVRDALARLDPESAWFNLGDRDLALSIRRTELLAEGKKLSEITDLFRNLLDVKYRIIPASDYPVTTHIRTIKGWMHLQEFWVKNKASLDPLEVEYKGIMEALPSHGLLEPSRFTLLCPANPITSILPIVSLKGVKESLRRSMTVAVSPFVGDAPFSGPAGLLMKACGMGPSSLSVAKLYSEFLKLLIVDNEEDRTIIGAVKDMGIECIRRNTRLTNKEVQLSFWKDLSEIL